MRRYCLVVAASAVFGCSSSSSSTAAPADTGADTGEYASFVCGSGTMVSGQLRIQDSDSLRNLDGVTATSTTCPGVSAVTQENGIFLYQFPKDQPVSVRFVKPGYFTIISEEAKWHADGADDFTYMVATKHTELFPDYAATNAYAIVGVTYEGADDAGPCSDPGGVTFQVTGKPDVKVVYASSLTPPKVDTTLKATMSKVGAAIVGPLPAGTIEITGAKTGCKVVNFSGPRREFTGKVNVEAGAITYVLLQLTP